ncbi:3-hydroxyacyl-CoA dehydrogenase family protein [Acidobacteriota bacterium]
MKDAAFSRIGIVGTGKMAVGIFYRLRDFNYFLVWISRSEEKKEELIKKFNRKIKRLRKSDTIDEETCSQRMSNTLISDDRNELRDCDLIIEAIIEDREIKTRLFKELDSIVNKDCVFTTSTSSMKPAWLCPSETRKEKFAALHFFYPVQFSNILEIMSHSEGSAETAERLKEFGKAIGCNPILLPDEGAFILNKLTSHPHVRALKFYKEGILTYKEIDELMRENMFSKGAFEYADSVGFDTMIAATEVYMNDMDHTQYFPLAMATLQELADKGDLGIKSGKGWYSYTAGVEDEPSLPVTKIGVEEREQYKESVLQQLVCVYINMCYDAVSKSYLTEEEVETAMNEYAGVEKGPGRLADEFGGLENVNMMLLQYLKTTDDEVYRPCPFIEKKVSV